MQSDPIRGRLRRAPLVARVGDAEKVHHRRSPLAKASLRRAASTRPLCRVRCRSSHVVDPVFESIRQRYPSLRYRQVKLTRWVNLRAREKSFGEIIPRRQEMLFRAGLLLVENFFWTLVFIILGCGSLLQHLLGELAVRLQIFYFFFPRLSNILVIFGSGDSVRTGIMTWNVEPRQAFSS